MYIECVWLGCLSSDQISKSVGKETCGREGGRDKDEKLEGLESLTSELADPRSKSLLSKKLSTSHMSGLSGIKYEL